MRFIHAADIHLDSPLTGLTAYADAPVELLRRATRDAFERLVDEAIEQLVDFMVIAGDLYDGTWKDHNTGIYFCKQMGRLKNAGIPVYLLFGNHDAESEMTKKLLLPDNVFVFESRRSSTFTVDGLNVALHGRSFRNAATTENLVMGYPAPTPGVFNIGVLHTGLEGNSAHANYAPCSIDELHAKGYDYWALGHVHDYQRWDGPSTIVFPGNLQGRHVRETGARGAVLVTVDAAGNTHVERLLVDVLRWHCVDVDAGACASFDAVVCAIGTALEKLLERAPANLPCAVRVSVVGRTAVHGALFGLERQLRLEVLGIAAALGAERLWIEKVRIVTTGVDDGQAIAARADALADLQEILAQAHEDPEFLKALQADLLVLVGKAPLELQSSVAYFDAIRAGDLQPLVDEVRPGLIAHLAGMD
ncbi:MAG: DNA repair exonuclease [Burkholderiaceae bacterium]